jgi:hypothetical protein
MACGPGLGGLGPPWHGSGRSGGLADGWADKGRVYCWDGKHGALAVVDRRCFIAARRRRWWAKTEDGNAV